MQVFISWAGAHAKQVGLALDGWLKLVVNEVETFISDQDIMLGEVGLAAIDDRLADAGFGIVVVTLENHATPWINYEAGAIAKKVGQVRSRVVPIRVDIERPTDIDGPLGQFQSAKLDRDGIERLVKSLADAAGADLSTVLTRFEDMWPRLQSKLAAIEAPANTPPTPERPEKELLEEVLTHVRALRTAAGPDRLQALRSGAAFMTHVAVSAARRYDVQPLEVTIRDGLDSDVIIEVELPGRTAPGVERRIRNRICEDTGLAPRQVVIRLGTVFDGDPTWDEVMDEQAAAQETAAATVDAAERELE